ncbi:MAG TPA: hypothetical protein VFM45_08145 [Anaeromyxobacteraceae bacterium]|nr:hypothetical protein [Anaeromyxobacteraceae bacterium]
MSSPTAARPAALQVSEEKYSAGLVNDATGLKVAFKGTISTVNPAAVLNPFVDAVHAQLSGANVKEIRVDFTELEFCNSSGFKAFIHWIQKVQGLPEGQRYKLRFVSSPARKWQRTSLLALSCYAPGLVEIA